MFQRFDVNGDLRLENAEYARLLRTYADDYLKRFTKEYATVKRMADQMTKWNQPKFSYRFCDFVKKYVEQFMLQGQRDILSKTKSWGYRRVDVMCNDLLKF